MKSAILRSSLCLLLAAVVLSLASASAAPDDEAGE